MDKVIYNVSIKLSEFDENSIYITEYPIIEEYEDIYVVLDAQEYENELNYFQENGITEDEIDKEDYFMEIYKVYDEDEISLNIPYSENYILTHESNVYSLKKEVGFNIVCEHLMKVLNKKEKEITKHKKKLNNLKL